MGSAFVLKELISRVMTSLRDEYLTFDEVFKGILYWATEMI